jgi:hypothetical protein
MLAKPCVNLVAASRGIYFQKARLRIHFSSRRHPPLLDLFPLAHERLHVPGRLHQTVKIEEQAIAICQLGRNIDMQKGTRQFSRFPYHAVAVLIRLPRLDEVTLIDVSLHGVLVALNTAAEIRTGEQTRLRVLTERGNQSFEVEALVAHRSGQFVGLEISSIDQHARDILRQLIEMNLGAPELATRTLPALLDENIAWIPTFAPGQQHAENAAAAPQELHA